MSITFCTQNFEDAMLWRALGYIPNGSYIDVGTQQLKEHKVKLFRVVALGSRTDWVITNDPSQHSTDGVQKVCAIRWKIEHFHRELKQVTGAAKWQCRKAWTQRNHIACAVLVWVRLTELARSAATTAYQIKQCMLTQYLKQELRSPSVRFLQPRNQTA